MKISLNTNQTKNINNKNAVAFKGLYNNKILLNGLKLAADNGTLFSAGAMLAMSMTARPLAIMATPKTDIENKKYACAKSFSSGIINFIIALAASLPIANAVKKINQNPSKYLKQKTITNLQGTAKTLSESKKYSFATQLFKLGVGLLIAAPKSSLTCELIPPIMSKVFHKKEQPRISHSQNIKKGKVISFKGAYDKTAEHLAKGIGKLIDTKPLQDLAKRFYDSNLSQHIMSLTDIVLTLTFVKQTAKNKKISEKRKKPLIYNSLISTGLCLTGGYALNSATEVQTKKFIQKFREANKDLPNLEKYVEGIKIAKPVLLLAGIYYIVIPVIATFLADRTDKS